MSTYISEDFQELWASKGFDQMSEIQAQLYPVIQEGKSAIAISPTGTGKTLAYLLPLLEKIEKNNSLQLIILAPSQELVKQIGEVTKEWAKVKKLEVTIILGSANVQRQLDSLKNKPEIIVASPGRLLELIQQTKKIKLHQVSAIVYDEADYLYEDDQAKTVEEITLKLMRDVQKIWVSATFGDSLKAVAESMENTPTILDETASKLDNINHYGIMVQNRQKLQYLKRLAQIDGMRAIVYFEQVNEVDQVAVKLSFDGLKIASLHGQLSKQEREKAINSFRRGEITFLLTTDVAARGLDIEDLPYVIHYNRVSDTRTYFHRSGRTGRMGKSGTVISLLNEQEFRDLSGLLNSEGITLAERFCYQGSLLTFDEKEALRDTNVIQEKSKVKPKVKSKAKPKTQTQTQKNRQPQAKVIKPTEVKKKNRHRDAKNKGKRKPKIIQESQENQENQENQ